MRFLDEIRGLSGREKLRLAWDLFMVWVALINLWLILFDLTYLWARPVSLRTVPVLVRLYDPVKGIEPHPLTEEFLNELELTRRLVERSPDTPRVVVRPVVRTVGEVVVDTTLETVAATFTSPEGRDALHRGVKAVLDELLAGAAVAQAETLTREIVLQVIDHMKDVVAVKKWSLPEEQRPRVPFPWETGPG